MSADYGLGIVPAQVANVGQDLANADGLAFRGALDEVTLADTTARFFPEYRDRVFPP